MQIPYDEIFYTNNGNYPYEIIGEVHGRRKPTVTIRFLNTGYECDRELRDVLRGKVKDPYEKTIFGVACKGITICKKGTIAAIIYSIWINLVSRIYNPENKSYITDHENGRTREMKEEWLCFDNFYEYIISNKDYVNKLNENLNGNGDWKFVHKDTSNKSVNHLYYDESTTEMISKDEMSLRIIKNNKENKSTSSKYIGVNKTSAGNYTIRISNENWRDGIISMAFTNEDAAAIVANYYFRLFGRPEYQNKIDTDMTFQEAMSYRFKPKKNELMYHTVDNSIPYDENEANKEKAKIEDATTKAKNKKERIHESYLKRRASFKEAIKDGIPFNVRLKSKKYGYYKILNIVNPYPNNNPIVRIKFELTGTERDVELCSAVNGTARDPYYPVVCGFGYTGERIVDHKDPIIGTLYNRWKLMIERCYSPKSNMFPYYGGIGITIDPRWAYFWNYYEDMVNKPGFSEFAKDPSKWDIDKDYLQQDVPMNMRVYSNETTCFMPTENNLYYKILESKEVGKFPYVGVRSDSHNCGYFVSDIVNPKTGLRERTQKFLTPEAAATVYDFYAHMYYNRPSVNNTGMTVEEAIKQSCNYGKKKMYTLINK